MNIEADNIEMNDAGLDPPEHVFVFEMRCKVTDYMRRDGLELVVEDVRFETFEERPVSNNVLTKSFIETSE